MISGLGYAGILVGLIAASVLAVRGARQARPGAAVARTPLRPVVLVMVGAAAAAFVALEVALLGDRFSVGYVAAHSSRGTPILFKVAAAWGAPGGSVLTGALLLAMGVALVFRGVDDGDRLGAATVAVLGGAGTCLFALLATVANPFGPVVPVPPDGAGPPLPASLLAAVHPLLLIAGYVALAVALAFAIAARMLPGATEGWTVRARRWAVPGWGALTAGIACRALWSATELGWRGPWAWDVGRNPWMGAWLLSTASLLALGSRPPRGLGASRRALGRAAAGVIMLALGAPAIALAARPVGGPVVAAGRDLASVSTAEMARVVAANPTVTGMRLALVERYLNAGDAKDAHDHASVALALDPPAAQRQEALKFLGWSAALMGRAQEGAAFLEQSLALDANDRDAAWFLANVRLVGLDDPAGAIPLLQQLLGGTMSDVQRRAIEERLFDAHLRAGRAPAP